MDKRKRYKIWTDWIKDAHTKIDYTGITVNSKRLGYIKSQARPKLTYFWEKKVQARCEGVVGDQQLDSNNRTRGEKGTGIKATTILNKLRKAGLKVKTGRVELSKIYPTDKAQNVGDFFSIWSY